MKASPDSAEITNQSATARSARFSARVPGIGHLRWLWMMSTSSSSAASRASWSGDMASSSA